MAKITYGASAVPEPIKREPESNFPLTRINFILMAVAGALIVIGFLLMLGGSTTTEAFNPDIFSTRRIIVGPGVAFIGFIAMGAAIVYRPRRAPESGEAEVAAEEK